jgi:hypothetical protein
VAINFSNPEDYISGAFGSTPTSTGVTTQQIINNPFQNPVDPGVDFDPNSSVNRGILNTPDPTQPKPPSLLQRFLGPQMQMARTGFYTPGNDYTGTSNTILRKGAHAAVADRLAKIQFVAGTSGGMQNRVAYIQYWSKSSVEQKTTAPRVTETSVKLSPSNLANTVNGLTTPSGQPLPPAQAPAQATLESCSGLNATAGQFNSLGGSFQGSPEALVNDFGLLTPRAEQELAKYESQYNTVANDPRYGQKFLSSISPENTPARLRERVRGESDDGLPAEANLGDAARIIAAAGANAAQSVTNNIYTPNGCQAALQSQSDVLLASARPEVFPLAPPQSVPPGVQILPAPRSGQFDTPSTIAPSVQPTQPIPQQKVIPDPTVPGQLPPWSFPSGQSIRGVPGGNFTPSGSSQLPPWSFPTGPLLNANPGTPSQTPQSNQAVWQFLFNPEELQLESGPDYNRAETWGVSDPENSGQPLSWRSNKNRKLTFGKVLLTGYVLGRRVDSLERGLQQLFMARSGPGMDGPPVLEFVWGVRKFGPCVIQNVRVRERAWDAGVLVNAEVSFDLEQVPEWTINDGAVDIARPGRQSLVNDPLLPRNQPEATPPPSTGATPPAKDQPGGGGGRPDPLASQTYDQRKCQRAYFYAGLFKQFESKINNQGAGRFRPSFTNILFATREETRRISSEFLVKYQDAVQELGSDFSSPSEATRIYSRIENILNPNRPEGRLDGNQIKSYVNGYISEAFRKAETIYKNSTKCPGTSGAAVLQRQTPSALSNPTNL